jgi:hypothetical protein
MLHLVVGGTVHFPTFMEKLGCCSVTFFVLRPVLEKTTLQLSVAAPLVTENLFFCHQLNAQIY